MPRSVEALVTPMVMKWAREKAGFDVETAAKKIRRSPDEILGWEDGSIQLTYPQFMYQLE